MARGGTFLGLEGYAMADAVRGELLVKQTGLYQQRKMIDALDVIEWLKQNRSAAELSGCCCGRQLVRHETRGHEVCPMTYEPCRQLMVEVGSIPTKLIV